MFCFCVRRTDIREVVFGPLFQGEGEVSDVTVSGMSVGKRRESCGI